MAVLIPRPHRRLGVVLAAALTLSSCAVTPPAGVPAETPGPQSVAPTATPSGSATSGAPPVTSPRASITARPSSTTARPTVPAVTATGRLTFYDKNLVSDALKGTCQTRSGTPTLAVTDPANDFYGTVTVTATLNGAKSKVSGFTIAFGESSEGVDKLTTGSAKTTRTLKVTGNAYQVSGRGQLHENGKPTTVIPYSLTVTCAGARW